MTHRLSVELGVALEAVTRSCGLCRQVQEKLVTGETLAKRDRSPVTVADYGSQALITLALRRAFPGDPIVGEEESSLLRQDGSPLERVRDLLSEQGEFLDREALLDLLDCGATSPAQAKRFWTVDPIDGTKGFLRKEQYAVALALVEDGDVVLGVLGCPNYHSNSEGPTPPGGMVAFAVKGMGAFVRSLSGRVSEQISVDRIIDPAQARFCEPVEAEHANLDHHAKISRYLGMTLPPLRMDSQCKYAAVARGDASIYLRFPKDASYQETIWDHAAGSVIIAEAGGTVSDIDGVPLDFSGGRLLRKNRGIVATNSALHQRVLDSIAALSGRAGS